MAQLDVSDLMLDPDFADTLVLITRVSSINEFGEPVLTETSSNIIGIVQQGGSDELARLPEGAKLSEAISVFHKSILSTERAGGYADIIVWQGQRYQVQDIEEPYSHYGGGFSKAICLLEPAHV